MPVKVSLYPFSVIAYVKKEYNFMKMINFHRGNAICG